MEGRKAQAAFCNEQKNPPQMTPDLKKFIENIVATHTRTRPPSATRAFLSWATPRAAAATNWSLKWLVGKPSLYVMDSVGRHFLATGAGVFAGYHYGEEIITFVTGLVV
jgi:hypothetical protein